MIVVPGDQSSPQPEPSSTPSRAPATVLGDMANASPQPTPEPSPAPIAPVFQMKEPQAKEPDYFPEGSYEDASIRAARAKEYGKSPEQAARIFNLESKTGLPTDYVEKNLDELEKESEVQGFSAVNYSKTNPKYASWLAQNSNNYALGKDDHKNGEDLEASIKDYSIMQSAYDALGAGFAQASKSLVEVPAMAYDLSKLPQNIAAHVFDAPELERKAPEFMRKNPVTQYFDEAANYFQTHNPDLQGDIFQLAMNKKYAQAGRALFAQMVTNVPNWSAMAMMGSQGLVKEGLALAATLAASDAASSPENQAAGPAAGTLNAITKGGFEALFEQTPSLIGKWANAMTKNLAPQTKAEILKSFSQMIAESVIQEGTEEVLTGYSQDLTDYFTGINPDALKGIHSRRVNEFLVGGAMGGWLTSPAGAGIGIARLKQLKQATIQKDFYAALGDSAEASKIKERLPQKYQEMVSHITKDGPIENIYMPVEKFTELFQSYEDGGLPGALSDLEAEGSYEVAKESGGLVKIKTSVWASRVAGTDLYKRAADDITFDPKQLTKNEADEAIKSFQESDKLDESKFDGSSVVEGMSVQQQVEKMLVSSGMTPENARKNAVVYRFFDTLSKRTGKTAQQLFGEYNLKINNAVPPVQQNNVQPEDVTKQFDFGPILDEIRKGPKKPEGKSILSFIRSKGGISPGGLSADVADLEKGKKGRKLVNKGGLDIDKIALDAFESGYIKERDIPQLIEAIRKEISGEPVYPIGSQEPSNADLEREAVQEMVDRLGLDLSAMTNERAIQAIQENKPKEITFFQSKNDRLDKAKELGFDTSRPLFHGTKKEFDSFDTDMTDRHAMYGKGVYFSTTKDYATEWAGKKGRVVDAFIRSEKPFSILDADQAVIDDFYKEFQSIKGKSFKNPKSNFQDNYSIISYAKGVVPPNRVTEILQRHGYTSLESPMDQIVVVFDAKNIRSVDAEFDPEKIQSKRIFDQMKRGRILFDQNGNFNIEFLKSADSTTFLHESAHFFLEVMGDQVSKEGASDSLKQDYEKILNYLGVESKDQITEKEHEKFAESFEKYLMEGKAPSSALREAFSTFKAWMIATYKSILSMYPKVTLSQDIRDVFDRMLATEEEIENARHEIAADPLIPNADGVMSKEDALKYVKLIDEEREQASDQLRAKALHNLSREIAKIKKDREKAIRAEVTKEVEQEPGQVVLSMIKDGQIPGRGDLPGGVENLKIDKKTAQSLYDEEVLNKLPKGVLSRDGLHPDVVASLTMGPAVTGADLISTLVNTPNKKERIEQLTQMRLLEEFPDPTLDGSLVEEALKAVHNDAGIERRVFEIDTLMKNKPAAVKGMVRKFANRRLTVEQFRNRAELTIGATQIRDIKPYVYQRAEVKYAKEAINAFLKGDFDGAIEAKQKEIFNHELYRISVKANEEIEKSLEKFNKAWQSNEKLSKTRDMSLVNAARAILSEFKLGKTDRDADYYLKSMQAYDEDAYNQMKELVATATAQAVDYRDASFNAFSDLSNTFNAIWDLAKLQHQITIDGKKMDRFQAQEEMTTAIQELSQNKKKGEEYARAFDDKDQRRMTIGSLKSAMTRVEAWADFMDGGKFDGPFRKYIWEPISGGVTQYRLNKNQYIEKLRDLIVAHTKGFTENQIAAPELIGLPNDQGQPSPYRFKNKAELLGAMLHIGNESNLRKLLVGNDWGTLDENKKLDTSNWDSFISRMHKEGVLVKEDYDFLQSVWDLMAELKPAAQKAHKEIYGYHFSEVTNNEFTTPFGTYKGGYAPAAIDRLRVENTKIQQKALEEGTTANYFPSQINGFTKSRVESYAAPLSMDLNLVPMHIDQVLRFSHITPRMRDVSKMLFDKSFRAQLNGFDPNIVKDVLLPWLDRAVKQSVVLPSQNKALDRFFRAVRSHTGMATMFLNIPNTLQQYTGVVVAAVKVKPKFLRNATWNFIKGSKPMADFAYERSDFMKTKISFQMAEASKEINKILDKPSNTQKVKEWFQDNAYVLQAIAQNQVDLIVWSAAYAQAEEQGANEKVRVQQADSAVRMTQGTFAPEDVSRFETGTPMARLFTMFTSYFNMLANLLGTEYGKIMHQEMGIKKNASRAFYIYAVGFMIPAVMSGAIMQALSGKGFDADDDDDYLDDFMRLFLGEQFKTGTALVPIVGQAVNAGMNRFNKSRWDDRIALSPAVSQLEAVVGVPYDVYRVYETEKVSKNAIRDSLTLLSLISGVPVLPLSKPINYLMDVNSGKTEPTNPIEFTRGLITGRSDAR